MTQTLTLEHFTVEALTDIVEINFGVVGLRH